MIDDTYQYLTTSENYNIVIQMVTTLSPRRPRLPKAFRVSTTSRAVRAINW